MPPEVCDKHIDLVTIAARTEERLIALDERMIMSQKTFFDHIRQGKGWRGIVLSTIIVVAIEIMGFAYLYGMLTEKVCGNEKNIQRLLNQQHVAAIEKEVNHDRLYQNALDGDWSNRDLSSYIAESDSKSN